MKSSTTLALWIGALLTTPTIAAPPPVEAFARRPAVVDVDLSPSGKRLTWIEDTGRAARLIVHDLPSGKDLRSITAPPGLRLHTVYFANDDTVLLNESRADSVSPGKREVFEQQRWVAIDVAAGPERVMLQTKNSGERQWVTGSTLERRHSAKAGKIYMSTLDFSNTSYRTGTGSRLSGGRNDSGWESHLYEVDLRSGEGKPVGDGTAYTTGWLIDESGERIARAD